MLTTLNRVPQDAPYAIQTIAIPIFEVGDSEEDLVVGSAKPGYPFQIVAVQAFFATVTGSPTVDVQIDDASALDDPIEPTAETLEEATLAEDIEAIRGKADEPINIVVNTGASDGLEAGYVLVMIRPFGLRGD